MHELQRSSENAELEDKERNALWNTQTNLSLEIRRLRSRQKTLEDEVVKANLEWVEQSKTVKKLQAELESRFDRREEDLDTLQENLRNARAKVRKFEKASEVDKQSWKKIADFANNKAVWNITEEVGRISGEVSSGANRGISSLSTPDPTTPAFGRDRLHETTSPGPDTTSLSLPLKPKSTYELPIGMTLVREVGQNHSHSHEH